MLLGHLVNAMDDYSYGMGIDKSDVRFVIHFSMAKSIEGYYQEAGRAGRDGHDSKCVLFFSTADVSRIRGLIQMPGKGKTNQQKERHLDLLKCMYEYCVEEHECRRVMLVKYFGQDFTKKECAKTCDNCLKARY